jgi:hypothetical protein
MTFLTAQQYDNYSYRFFLEDDGSYVVKIFLEDSHKTTRYHKDREEVLQKYKEYFPELKQFI